MNRMYVRAAGMACPLGLTFPASVAAMRAGISRRYGSRYRDDRLRPIVASFLREPLAGTAVGEARWLFLLAHALADLARQVGEQAFRTMPVCLVAPASESRLRDVLPASLRDDFDLGLPGENLHVVGQVGANLHGALRQARSRLTGAPCIVAAADSLISAPRLLALAAQKRLLVKGNADGVVPGEAACAMVLGPERQGALACIAGVGAGHEPSRLDNDVPLRADGLLQAARAALAEAGLSAEQLDFRLSDAAGESFHFKEQALFVARLLRERKPEFPLWLPAETLGHTGAAAGLCSLLMAAGAWSRGYAPGGRALACVGDDDGARVAVVVEQVE